jgi:hypothetical protein
MDDPCTKVERSPSDSTYENNPKKREIPELHARVLCSEVFEVLFEEFESFLSIFTENPHCYIFLRIISTL